MNTSGTTLTSWVLGIGAVLVATAIGYIFSTARDLNQQVHVLQSQMVELKHDYEQGPSVEYRTEEAARWAKRDQEYDRNREKLQNLEARLSKLEGGAR